MRENRTHGSTRRREATPDQSASPRGPRKPPADPTTQQPRRQSSHVRRLCSAARGGVCEADRSKCATEPRAPATSPCESSGRVGTIADAIDARRELLHTVRSATAIAQFCVGDTVMFNASIRPRYLRHEVAVITELDDHWVTVRLWRPVGRFCDGEVRCPPLALQKLDRASAT